MDATDCDILFDMRYYQKATKIVGSFCGDGYLRTMLMQGVAGAMPAKAIIQ
jgi:hypothetical protein